MDTDDIKSNAMHWAVMSGGQYRVCQRTVQRLPPGVYVSSSDDHGHRMFAQRRLDVDALIDFPGSMPSQILEEIDRFWTLGDRFRNYGFLHRRGYLIHGKQGSGKSSLIHLLIARAVEKGIVAFLCENPYEFVTGVQQFREVEPERPILCVFEDIDSIIGYQGDSILLQWLDGNLQVNKVINIATTNFPEKLDRRVRSRPRRFDRVLHIDSPDARLRDAYFARKLTDLTAGERRRWVEISDGLSFAALAELIISVVCLDNELSNTAVLLKELECHRPSSEDYDEGAEPMPHGNSRATLRRWEEEAIPF